MFFSDSSLSPPYCTSSASVFASSHLSGKLKRSRNWSTNVSLPGLSTSRISTSRPLTSVDEAGEWADNEAESLSLLSSENATFYTRARPGKNASNLSNPKKTLATPKAKEQHPKNVQEVAPIRKKTSPTRSKTTNSKRTSPPANQQEVPPPQRRGPQQARGLKEFSSKESVDLEKKNGNLEIRELAREIEGKRGEERTMADHKQESFKRRVGGVTHYHRTAQNTNKQRDRDRKDSGHRDAKLKSSEDSNTKKEIKRESPTSFKGILKGKRPVDFPREAKGRDTSHSKEGSQELSVVSAQGTPHSPKGPISPGPWKVPSSAKILTEAEVLGDPL